MQADDLRAYLSEKILLIEDEEILTAIKTIIERELRARSAEPGAVAPAKAPLPDDIQPIAKEVEEEEKNQKIEEWLKNL